jgi:hypothetical protein
MADEPAGDEMPVENLFVLLGHVDDFVILFGL